jgi:tetratricopeptide (TPR) repeat protein
MTTANELKDQGLQLFREDKLAEAAAKFEEAAQLYEAAGDAVASAEMHNNLCVVRLAEKNYDAALSAVQGTPALFAQHGLKLRQAQAIGNLANALDGAGQLDEAARRYEEAIDLYKELGDTENRAACWKALSNLQIRQDDKLQSLASMQNALSLQSQLSPKEKTLKGLIDKAFTLMKAKGM